MAMQVPFVGFHPMQTSEHMAAAGWHFLCCKTFFHFSGPVFLVKPFFQTQTRSSFFVNHKTTEKNCELL